MKNNHRGKAGLSSGCEFRAWGLCALLAVSSVALPGVGCRTVGKSDPAQIASVEIHGHPLPRVRDVTAEVFHEHGYEVMKRGWVDLVFEREGSSMNNIAYGNWMGSGIWVRAKVRIADISPEESRIDCEAFLLRNRGEPTEEEIKIRKIHSHQYQKLLNEVAKRLKAE
jgi:hypothetical protein